MYSETPRDRYAVTFLFIQKFGISIENFILSGSEYFSSFKMWYVQYVYKYFLSSHLSFCSICSKNLFESTCMRKSASLKQEDQ